MSWFSLIQAESSVYRSQHFIRSVLTGQIIGEYAVDHLLKRNSTYLRVREVISLYFLKKLSPVFQPISTQLSEKILKRVVGDKDFCHLFPEIFPHPQSEVLSAPDSRDGLITFFSGIFERFMDDGNAFNSWIQAYSKGEEAVDLLAEKALILLFRPFCQKAVKVTFKVITKNIIENAIDSGCRKGITMIGLAVLYRLALGVIHSAAKGGTGSTARHTFIFLKNYLPHPTHALSAVTAFHVANMVKILYNNIYSNESHDKENIKALFSNQIKNSIFNALKEKKAYKTLNQTFTEERIQHFIDLLINEIIENHWKELSQMRVLNLPLVK